MKILDPIEQRDFRRGRISKTAVTDALIPNNSVSECLNVVFDEIIGGIRVRAGNSDYKTVVGSPATYSNTPLGFIAFLLAAATKSIAVFKNTGNANSTIYYWNGSTWAASATTNLSGTAKNRFAVLNGSVFRANGTDAMTSSSDSGANWVTTNCITTNSVVPSLLIVFKNIMLASGYTGFRSRVYFSSVVDPNSSPFVTWNTDPDTGDWIDINPDDGGQITGFSDTSDVVLVFKQNAMYRLDVITKTTDTQNIYNIGAVSQEAIVKCLGLTYFYTGFDFRRTDGTFPEEISRLGVADFFAAIADSSQVYTGTDGLNVYVSIGTVTVNGRTYTNCVLKFSPRDESWSVHTYSRRLGVGQIFSTSFLTMFQTYEGVIEQINTGNNDNAVAIPYLIETQDFEMGARSHTKQISDKIVVYTQYGGEGSFLVKVNDGDFESCNMQLDDRVNVGIDNINFEGQFFTFMWRGEALNMRPIFEGIHLPNVSDLGITKNE